MSGDHGEQAVSSGERSPREGLSAGRSSGTLHESRRGADWGTTSLRQPGAGLDENAGCTRHARITRREAERARREDVGHSSAEHAHAGPSRAQPLARRTSGRTKGSFGCAASQHAGPAVHSRGVALRATFCACCLESLSGQTSPREGGGFVCWWCCPSFGGLESE
jgi:hypothetical protein